MKPVRNKENPAKIIRWKDGSLECFCGTMAEAENYAKNKSKVIKQTYIIAGKKRSRISTPLSSKYQDGTL